MGKFNSRRTFVTPSARARSAVVTTTVTPDTRTHEGGAGYSRDARSELFLATVGAFVAEDSFYESGNDRVERVRNLVHTVALETGADGEPVGVTWLTDFTRWLRGEGNIRTAAVVVAAEAVRALTQARRNPDCRALVSAAINRADEPGELFAYWDSRYGRPVPNSIKRGLADAMVRKYSEYSALKYDTASTDKRFGKLIQMMHPTPKTLQQAELFRWLIERGASWGSGEIPESLAMVRARHELESVPKAARRSLVVEKIGVPITERLEAAGATWEYLSGWLNDGKGMDADAWQAVLPSMGYMARLRNLANFDRAGISDEVAAQVAAYLADPKEVARSRQFPYRFLAAYKHAPSTRWAHALDKALTASLSNLPTLPGKSLILVDTSGSMSTVNLSQHSKMSPIEAAAVFGVALAMRNPGSELYGWATGVFKHDIPRGASVLKQIEAFTRRVGEAGHGTDMHGAVRSTFRDHDRVFLISDMQTVGGHYGLGVSDTVPANVPIYGFNLGGYAAAAMATGAGNRHEFGGLSDATFRMIPLIEAGKNAGWPWEKSGS